MTSFHFIFMLMLLKLEKNEDNHDKFFGWLLLITVGIFIWFLAVEVSMIETTILESDRENDDAQEEEVEDEDEVNDDEYSSESFLMSDDGICAEDP